MPGYNIHLGTSNTFNPITARPSMSYATAESDKSATNKFYGAPSPYYTNPSLVSLPSPLYALGSTTPSFDATNDLYFNTHFYSNQMHYQQTKNNNDNIYNGNDNDNDNDNDNENESMFYDKDDLNANDNLQNNNNNNTTTNLHSLYSNHRKKVHSSYGYGFAQYPQRSVSDPNATMFRCSIFLSLFF